MAGLPSRTPRKDTHLGIYVAHLATSKFREGTMILFIFHWTEENRWEKVDYSVIVE